MSNYENIDIVSLGGVGGCDITYAFKELKNIECLTYPYSWIVTTQSFIIKSFNSFENFFNFNKEDLHPQVGTVIHDGTKKAVMLHDFNNFQIEKNNVIEKYNRRFNRLNETLENNKKLIFVRLPDNLNSPMCPIGLYDNIYLREDEDISLWNDFFNSICLKYPNKEIHLVIVTDILDKVINKPENINKNLHLFYLENHKNTVELSKLLNNILKIISK